MNLLAAVGLFDIGDSLTFPVEIEGPKLGSFPGAWVGVISNRLKFLEIAFNGEPTAIC